MELKMIKVRDETHTRLDRLGARRETFDKIINRLIDHWEKCGDIE